MLLNMMMAGGVARGIKGLSQKKQAKKIDDTRPEYTMPEDLLNTNAMYKAAKNGRMAGAGIVENQIDQGMAETVAGAHKIGGSAIDQLAAISGAQGQKASSQQNLAMQEQQFQQSMMGGLAQSNQAVAAGRDVEFDYNKNQEFQYNRRKKNMLDSAGDYNQMQFFDSVSRAGSDILQLLPSLIPGV